MIPKIIHYCWFGRGEKSPLIENCLQSWQKYLPDYKIVEWNESNFDINCNRYVKEAYESKQWAFVSDVARLYALYNEGGIYLDTDLEVLKSFDCFLANSVFVGFESIDEICTAVIGAEPKHPVIKNWLSTYENSSFIKQDGSFDKTPNVKRITQYLRLNGLHFNAKKQRVGDVMVYGLNCFAPNNLMRIWDRYPKASYSVHHCDGSWRGRNDNKSSLRFKMRRYIVGRLKYIIGIRRVEKIKALLKKD